MSCTKNPKKFLFVKYNGSHEVKLDRIRMIGSRSWAEYEGEYSCIKCDVDLGTSILSQSELVSMGYNVNKLKELSTFDIFAKNAEELR